MAIAEPLGGIRIVDFGQYIAGPLAALLLAEQGAEVVHVDPPGGPRWDHAADAYYNRSKQRISLDLKQPSDLETARRLIAGADVVIENFRPGVMDRLGLGAEAMTAAHERLVYCSLPGFPSSDPRAQVPAWEGVVTAAAAGYLPFKDHWNQSAFGDPDVPDRERPLFNAVPMASNTAGVLGACSIVAALIGRLKSGRGQHIEVSLYDAMFEAIGGFITRGAGQGNARAALRLPGETRLCKGGGYVNSVAYARFIQWLLEAAGVIDAFAAEGLLDFDAVTSDPERNALMQKRYEELILTRTAEEWDEIAARLKIPMSAIRKTTFWLACEHARASRSILQVEDPVLGPTWMPGQPVAIDGDPAPVKHARHVANADRDAVLTESRMSGEQPRPTTEGLDPSRPLAGFRVLDLTQVVAGPTAGRLLADFGAEVIKINNPNDHRREALQQLNRGKRMLLLDIQSGQGQDIFWRLLEKTDVLLENLASDAMDRYGLGYPALKARRPSLVYVSVGAFAPGGPWADRRGHENQGQCVTGMMERYGGNGPPLMHPYLLNDVGTGIFASFGALLGLYLAHTTGAGCRAHATLTQTATLHQGPYMLDYKGKVWDEPRGLDAKGWSPVQRLYQAADGWFFLGAANAQIPLLEKVPGLEGTSSLSPSTLAPELERRFLSASRAEWVGRLQAAGFGAHETLNLSALIADPRAITDGILYFEQHGDARTPMSAPAPRFSATPLRDGLPALRMPGSDGRAILAEIGQSHRLDTLVEASVIRLPEGT